MSSALSKKAVISGATRGIGRAIAEALAAEGYDLAIGARNEKELRQTAKALSSLYPSREVMALPCDFSVKEQVAGFASRVLGIAEQWEAPDVLVNNVGMYSEGTVSGEAEGMMERFLNTNFLGAYQLTRALLPAMKRKGAGHIINICSIASRQPIVNAAAYSISKVALHTFSRLLCEELRQWNIKVTAVLPGPTLTSSWNGIPVEENKVIRPAEIAEAIVSALKQRSVVEELVIEPMVK